MRDRKESKIYYGPLEWHVCQHCTHPHITRVFVRPLLLIALPSVRLTSRRFTPLLSCWSILSYLGSEVQFRDFCLAPAVTNSGHRSTGQGWSDQDDHWYPRWFRRRGTKRSNPGLSWACSGHNYLSWPCGQIALRNTTFLGFTHERVGTLELLV